MRLGSIVTWYKLGWNALSNRITSKTTQGFSLDRGNLPNKRRQCYPGHFTFGTGGGTGGLAHRESVNFNIPAGARRPLKISITLMALWRP
jgi:hypothetical protein